MDIINRNNKLLFLLLFGTFLGFVVWKNYALAPRQNNTQREEGHAGKSVATSSLQQREQNKIYLAQDCLYEKAKNSDGLIEIPSDAVLKTLSYQQLACLYHRFVNNVGVLCKDINRLGHLSDGGWEVCNDRQYSLSNNCLVYSVGINNDFSFDDEIARQYGCEVHSFDPSMNQKSKKRSDKTFYHNIGMSDKNVHIPDKQKGWEMRTLGAMKQELGHTKRHLDVLKMDVEHWEWKVLPEAIASGFLNDVTTLDLELHSWVLEKGKYIYEPTAEVYMGYLKTLRKLHELGFRIFLTHKNVSCRFKSKFGMMRTSCQEIAMVQTKMKKNS